MEFSWLWQNFLSNALWALAILAGGIVLAYLRTKRPPLATVALYGLSAATLLSILFYTLTGHSVISPPRTDASNIQENVRQWTSGFGFAGASVPPAPNTDFAYQVTMPSGNPIVISRDPKNRPGYLQFQCVLSISPIHQEVMNKLTRDQAQAVLREVELELFRNRTFFQLVGADANHTTAIFLSRAAPVYNMTEADFGNDLDAMDAAMQTARGAFLLALQTDQCLSPRTSAAH
jgi:hypothetical protein